MNSAATPNGGRLQAYSGSPVLVTGGSGYIGGAVTQRLISLGAQVHVASRSAADVRGAHSHRGDITDSRFLGSLCSEVRPAVVFHLAGRTNAAKAIEHVRPTFEVNAAGTLALLLGVAEAVPDSSLVCCASMEELWSDTIAGSSPYGVSKLVASTYVSMFNALYGLNCVSLRPFFVYGPGRQPEDKLMPYVFRELRQGRFPAPRSASRAMDWVYIDDVAEAFLVAGLAKGPLPETPIDVGTGSLTRIDEVVARLARLMDHPLYGENTATSAQDQELSPAADTGPAIEHLEWQPSTELNDGLAATVRWYLDPAGPQED